MNWLVGLNALMLVNQQALALVGFLFGLALLPWLTGRWLHHLLLQHQLFPLWETFSLIA
jgi:hypothetical protein